MLKGRCRSRVALLAAWLVLLIYQLPGQSPRTVSSKPAEQEQSPRGSQGVPSVGQVEVFNGASRWTDGFETPHSSAMVSASSRSSTTTDTVDVINGAARRTQVFEEDQPPVTPQGPVAHKKAGKHLPQRALESAPAVPDVEVINGAQWETRRFEGAEDEIAAPWIGRRNIPPVVIGVVSVESASRRGNTVATASTAPIVVGIASSEATGHGENAKPVAYRIAPGPPKRPPYHPDPPGF
jgi:hypothetical protein